MYPIINFYGIKLIAFPIIGFIALATCTFVFLFAKKFKEIRQEYIFFHLVFIAILGAAIGGRLMSALTLMLSNNTGFISNIIHGGSVFYGGLLGGALGILLVCRVKNLDYLHYADTFVTLLPLGQAIGRIGCYCNGCCYGIETTSIFSVPYIINGVETQVFPTWFIESVFCLILFVVLYNCSLWDYRGARTLIYIIAYAAFRFLIEFFRGDSIRGHLGVFSSSQVISICLLAIVLPVAVIQVKNSFKEKQKNELQCISKC